LNRQGFDSSEHAAAAGVAAAVPHVADQPGAARTAAAVHQPPATQVATGFLMLFGGSGNRGRCIPLRPLRPAAHVIRWTVLVGGARYLQTNIIHQCTHGRLTYHLFVRVFVLPGQLGVHDFHTAIR
jgi:hypothetical protein